MKKLLVLSPHADDAELGCGGYIARTIAEGGEVLVAVATVGDTKFIHSGRVVPASERVEELKGSMSVLGVKDYRVLTYGFDTSLNTYPQGAMVAMLDELQQEFKPTEVLVPLPSAHQDHKYCWEVGVASTRPSYSRHSPTIVAAYEYPLTSWGEGSAARGFNGGLYVNVTSYWDAKVQALEKYKSQMRGANDLISIHGMEALGKLRGLESGFTYAELFYTLRARMP